MGYNRRKNQNVYKLNFTDPQFDGFEVRTIALPTDDLLRMQEMKQNPNAQRQDLMALYSIFIKAVLSWNLEDDDGNQIEPSAQALMNEDIEFAMGVINAYMINVAGVAEDLKAKFTDGSQSVEPMIPMESL